MLKSILVNTGLFAEDEVRIGRMFFWNPDPPYRGISVYIHQYALVEVVDAIMKADPFYGILEKRIETKS